MRKREEIARLKRMAEESATTADIHAISRIMDELAAAAAGGGDQSPLSLAEILSDDQERSA